MRKTQSVKGRSSDALDLGLWALDLVKVALWNPES
jgi:hypothetical protein